MENKVLTNEMKIAAGALGSLIKNDERAKALDAAMEEYERCEELNGLIAEYNTQQSLISNAVDSDEATREAISKRIDEIYTKVTEHPVYAAYIEAKENFDALMNEVYGELQFAITGSRPCAHDCSSCGGCH